MKKRANENRILQHIHDQFTALKADVMINETDPSQQTERIAELRKAEENAVTEYKVCESDFKNILQDAKEWSRHLNISTEAALLLMVYRESRFIHWHFDETMKKSNP